MKRCRSNNISTNSAKKKTYKRRKNNKKDYGLMIKIDKNIEDDINDWNQWVAATSTRNYLLNDGFLDVLATKASSFTKIKTSYQYHYIKTIGDYKTDNFVTYIMKQGLIFEKKIIRLIINKIGAKKVKNIGGDYNPRSRTQYLNTINAMNEGYPLIYQGIIRNYESKN